MFRWESQGHLLDGESGTQTRTCLRTRPRDAVRFQAQRPECQDRPRPGSRSHGSRGACARLISGSEGNPFSKFTPSGLSFSPALNYPEADCLRSAVPPAAAQPLRYSGSAARPKVQVAGEPEGGGRVGWGVEERPRQGSGQRGRVSPSDRGPATRSPRDASPPGGTKGRGNLSRARPGKIRPVVAMATESSPRAAREGALGAGEGPRSAGPAARPALRPRPPARARD